jgi:hypothetical protein
MAFGETLRKIFKGVNLKVEDIFLLEPFQIDFMKNIAPQKEFSALLFAYPDIKNYLKYKHPPILSFLKEVLDKYGPAKNKSELAKLIDDFLWEISFMIIYNKYPEVYDEKTTLGWNFKDITSVVSLKDKIVIDAGAGTGRVSFQVIKDAKVVYAIEPCTNLRNYIRKKANDSNISK